MIKRRQFIAGLGSAAAWPMVALAQQAAVPVIGVLSAQSAELDYKDVTVPILQGLRDAGYFESQNVAVEYRYAENQLDRLPALAADLVRRRVAVIVPAAISLLRQQRQRPRPYLSSLPPAVTRLHRVLSSASTGRAGTSLASPF
jgi:putative ABC transport system substrate-binding protein